jgi:hypothetical protein
MKIREGQWLDQSPEQLIDIAHWASDEEHSVYPVGTRDKSLLHCPDPAPFPFLLQGHRYLFKHAFHRHPDQFWTEVIAYRIGCLLDHIPVPPVFVAFDSDTGTCGALIEWFLGYPGQPEERFVHGGEIMMGMISDFDQKTGRQHNYHSMALYINLLESRGLLEGDWRSYLCRQFLFDALIGNTDRHQDNWGLLWRQNETGSVHVRLAPVFDNGTSLGYEIIERKMPGFRDEGRILKYIERGRHHIKWKLPDDRSVPHVELLRLLIDQEHRLNSAVESTLKVFRMDLFEAAVADMKRFEMPVQLSPERAEWILRLVEARYSRLKSNFL